MKGVNTKDKKILLEEIHKGVIERHRKADVPMIFKTMDCAENEWYGKNLNSGKISKLKFIASDTGTKILSLSTE